MGGECVLEVHGRVGSVYWRCVGGWGVCTGGAWVGVECVLYYEVRGCVLSSGEARLGYTRVQCR